MPGPLILRNIRVRGRRTSMKLDLRLWDALEEICQREDTDLDELCTWLDGVHGQSSLTAAVRVLLVSYFRARAEEAEHDRRIMPPTVLAGRKPTERRRFDA